MKIEIVKGERLVIANHLDQSFCVANQEQLLNCVMPFASTTFLHVHKYWPKAILLPQMGIYFIIFHPKHIVQCAKGDAL
jgi:hypothetical protein